jgi:hypothetical protein
MRYIYIIVNDIVIMLKYTITHYDVPPTGTLLSECGKN